MKTLKQIILAVIVLPPFLVVSNVNAQGQTQVGELVSIRGAQEKLVTGYGLVTGLDRTGDRTLRSQGSAFTVQSIANMLQNFDINIESDFLRTRNVAAVMVTGRISPYHQEGSSVDVTVSSLGDATSLKGGVLLQTPLIDPDDNDYVAKAQGPLVIGGIEAEIPGARVRRNQTNTGRVPNGGIVINSLPHQFDRSEKLGLILRNPNISNAERISQAINDTLALDIAEPAGAGLVEVEWPPEIQQQGDMTGFVNTIMQTTIQVDTPARVVVNERTGTIVAGGKVRISEVLVSHGDVQIETRQTPFVSQPPPLSPQGQTVTGTVPQAGITEQPAQTVVLEPNTNVTQLAASLNELGLTPRDIISIFQAIDRAGALKGKLVIM